ncbi:MAG TPA: DoxX family protein, partial [Segetibacter sp.]|nr:DoxX family protein [Segetibacter sp.]
MLKYLFSYSPMNQEAGISVIRIIVGLFMVYHGWEIFDNDTMKGYITRDSFKNYSSPELMVYMGKSAELASGLLLTFGFLTRLGCVILMLTMLYISFFVGDGKIWHEDQH